MLKKIYIPSAQPKQTTPQYVTKFYSETMKRTTKKN
ncbi:MAG: hypothetical protein RL757_2142 [Bacteroidota bacterium]|jgi:hypothetical protein